MVVDRLTCLLEGAVVTAVTGGARADATLTILAGADGGFRVRAGGGSGPEVAASVTMEPGPAADPLGSVAGLEIDLPAGNRLHAVVALLVEEAHSPRCGAPTLLSAYAQVVFVHVLRLAIERGLVVGGVLAGLGDPRLARAIVAIHSEPDRMWTAAGLAGEAGMSRAAFMARFRQVVGETPIAYLRRWRIMLARKALARGGRVGVVAREVGYGSADAFARAYRAAEGRLPSRAGSADRSGSLPHRRSPGRPVMRQKSP